ncbi:cytochrome c [Methylibium sp. Pch-M]|uniref:c-type cytochrome n=1 Tax=Methylibium sp. Pch-M TaxID=2082386 RepID=UPI0013EA60A8|nr:cytochrome c [Methylibium sp. Pch-M]
MTLARGAVFAALLGAALLSGPAALAQAPEGGASAALGRSLYTSYCARCHGVNMVSNGASFDLRSFPKDQRERFERSVTQGLRAMPAWGTTFQPDELASLWLFVSAGASPP